MHRPDNRGMRWSRAVLVAMLLCLGCLARPVHAQDQSREGGADAAVGTGEVKIEVERFGVGDVVRPGEWVGVRLRLMDGGLKPRDLIVQVPGQDPDGDPPLYRRELASNPGAWYGVWMYFRAPVATGVTPTFEVRAYESLPVEGEAAARRERFRTGRLLGQAFISPRSGMAAEPPEYIGVVGTRAYGLRGYVEPLPGGSAPQGHEPVQIVSGIQPEDAPDRWMGWSPYRVLVWGAGDPGKLRGERARALREWIERGGHLVVILPGYGETWTNASANELHDLLPAVKLSRQEGVDLSTYGPLLTRRRGATMPKDAVVHELTPLDGARPGEADRILNAPGGACIAARRLVGLGAVDLVGLDLNVRGVADQELVDADIFWNRLLGRRGSYRGAQELAEAEKAQRLNRSYPPRADYELDIPRLIAKTGTAGGALILGVVVFLLYWVVAGPGGYAVLRWRGLQRHAWLAYAAAAAGFTLIAWGGATALRPGKIEADHLTIMDHVFGQTIQRTRTWATVLVPWYGEATLSVGVEDDPVAPGRPRFINTIAAWIPPDTAAARGSFPDSRGYDIDVRAPWSITVPTRSTVKQVVADWAGTPRWRMPVPSGENGAIRRAAEGGRLEGTLRHELPGPLRNVVVIDVIRPLRLGARPDALLADARAYKLTSPWAPGEDLPLDEVTRGASVQANLAGNYLDQLASGAPGVASLMTGGGGGNPVDAPQRLMALSLYSQLKPPELDNMRSEVYRVRRGETYGWDLGRWFSQPCVIVMGFVGDETAKSASPTPLLVNGEEAPTRGLTLVRWVYPMPAEPPAYPARDSAPPGNPPGEPPTTEK